MRDSLHESKGILQVQADTEALLEKINNKKKELGSLEEVVQELEEKWAQVKDNALKQPTPAHREKILDKQLHSLIEKLASKQAQAEGLVSDIHVKENELTRLKGLCRRLDASTAKINAARNRYGRSSSQKGRLSSDYIMTWMAELRACKGNAAQVGFRALHFSFGHLGIYQDLFL